MFWIPIFWNNFIDDSTDFPVINISIIWRASFKLTLLRGSTSLTTEVLLQDRGSGTLSVSFEPEKENEGLTPEQFKGKRPV